MSFDYPDDLRYLDSHEYVRLEGDIATIGISAFAVDQLGDIVFLELPETGTDLEKGETFGTVESVKAVEDLKAPISGNVIDRNERLLEAPEELANDPYGEAWMLKIHISNPNDLDEAMTAEEYRTLVEGG
jgi:glycine cleavage system H protein